MYRVMQLSGSSARMPRSRRRANLLAETILESERIVLDKHVLEALRVWKFHKNKIRTNVMKENEVWVYSDTLGIVRSRNGALCATRATKQYPAFMRLVCRWVLDMQPQALPMPFPFTPDP